MAAFAVGTPVETGEPTVEVTVDRTNPLPVGLHIFSLIVEDDAGNRSQPATVEVVVKDSKLPTAVLRAPTQVEPGQSFVLDGRESSDVRPGKVVKFIWTLMR